MLKKATKPVNGKLVEIFVIMKILKTKFNCVFAVPPGHCAI